MYNTVLNIGHTMVSVSSLSAIRKMTTTKIGINAEMTSDKPILRPTIIRRTHK